METDDKSLGTDDDDKSLCVDDDYKSLLVDSDYKRIFADDDYKSTFGECDYKSPFADYAPSVEASRASHIAAFRKWLSENSHARFLLFSSLFIVVLAILVFLLSGTGHSEGGPEDAKTGWTRGPSGGGRPAYKAPVSRSARGSSAKILSTTLTGETVTRDFVVPTLIERVLTQSFGLTDEVTTGRFYSNFSEQSAALEKVDTSAMLPLRRGRDWILVEAPYLEKPDWATTEYTEVAGVARLRLVRSEGEWKVEDVKLFPRKRDRGQQIQEAWEARQDLDFFEAWQAWQATERMPPQETP